MPYIGNIVQDFSVNNAMLNTDSVTSIKIDDGTIVNADINASAAIAVSKLANFVTNNADNRLITGSGSANTLNGESSLTYGGTELLISNSSPSVKLNDTDNSGVVDINNVGGAAVFQSTGDTLFETNAAERMRINSSGNVGIGTTSPATLLHLKSSSADCALQIESTGSATDARLNLYGRSNGISQIRFGDEDDTNVGLLTYDHTGNYMMFRTADAERMRIDSSGHLLFAGTSEEITLQTSDGSDNGYLNLSGGGACNQNRGAQLVLSGNERSGLLGTCQLMAGNAGSASSVIQFFTGGSEQARVDASGNVGIGTSSPESKFAIKGSSGSGDLFSISDIAVPTSGDEYGVAMIKSNAAAYMLSITAYNSNGKGLRIYNNGGSTGRTSFEIAHAAGTKVLVDGNGNAGIGNGTPSSFHSSANNLVVGSGSGEEGITIFSGNGDNGVINFADSTSGSDSYEGRIVYSHDVNRMTFHVADGSERMRIDNNGRYYFNTSSQGAHGGFYNVDGSNSSLNALNVKGTTANYVMISSAGGSTGDHIFFSNYTSSNPGTNTGRIKDDGSNVTYHTTSDYRLKENVVAISDGINRVKQLNPIRHTWINNPTPGTIDGWLAHELDEVCPYAVDGEKDATNPDGSINPQGVDYGRITPLLTAALKEAIAKIETLETKVAALEAA